ncbi:hypothetical protein WI372_03815 [Gemmatimonadota bacterium DH-20]|uniref:DUF5683 domain-containing protein n=1 Tax=Gaopeijia maritima TaxID=3119007 RepID=A0ABU9E5Y4_9BACT
MPLALGGAALLIVSAEARGQRPERTVLASLGPSPRASVTGGVTGIGAAALLPGVTQAMEGRVWQGVLLGLVEAGGWWLYFDARAARDDGRSAYRDLAWTAARGSVRPRVDPGFEYYEDLLYWSRSGAFDADPSASGVQPERSPDTFNGRQWQLAAQIFLGGDVAADPSAPGYGAALEYYTGRAWGEGLTWDWSADPQARERFATLIDEADSAARRASVAAGVVVANHLLSAIEAFVAYRLGALPVEMRVTPDPRGVAPQLRVRIPWKF